MNEIRYVCLSDLHLGEEDSVLTHLTESGGEVDASGPSLVMVQLVECLREVLSKMGPSNDQPTLILNGDILELALCETHTATMVFERFVELLMPKAGKPLVGRILFIPGNHDHHLWEIAREMQYVSFTKRHEKGKDLKAPWHTTTLFLEEERHPVAMYLLSRMIPRVEGIKTQNVHVAYPNLGILNEDASRCAIFHHGHFAESIYWLMSQAKGWCFPGRSAPLDVWDVEAENFAWIDFFWSLLGRSGSAGSGLETIYEKLLAPASCRDLSANVASSLAGKIRLPVPERLRILGLEIVLNWLMRRYGSTERSSEYWPISRDTDMMFRHYLEGPLRRQIAYRLISRELGVSELSPEQKTPETLAAVNIPEMAFTFGHTHKPYCDVGLFKGYAGPVAVYNTGGWVVDTLEHDSNRGGSMVFFDKDLNGAAIEMYREREFMEDYGVCAPNGIGLHKPCADFQDNIRACVDPGRDPWRSFSVEVAKAVNQRRELLRKRVLIPIGSHEKMACGNITA